jgi:hypothetical protein
LQHFDFQFLSVANFFTSWSMFPYQS